MRPTRRAWLATSALALVGLIVLAGIVRRRPEALHHVWEAGNVLGTHEASGLAADRFARFAGSVELALLAVVLACIVHASRRRHLAAALATGVAFAAIFADSITRNAAIVGGRTYVLLCDDAFISMRYARNLANGLGLVYNRGERVEGYTNPLWTLLMAIPHALGLGDGLAPLFVIVTGGALLLASALLTRAVLAHERAPWALQVLAMVALLFDPSSFDFAMSGLETPLVGFAATLVVYGTLRRREAAVVVGLVLLPLTRADGAVVAASLVLWHALHESRTRQRPLLTALRERWVRGALVVGAAAAMMTFHLALYGEPAPNTYYLKMYAPGDRVVTGLATYGIRGALTYGLPFVFVLWASSLYAKARPARTMLVPIVLMWLYGIYVGGDAFLHLRFLAPLVPLLWIAVATAARAPWQAWAPATRAVAFIGLLLVAPVAAERGVLGSTWDREGWIRDNVVAARTIEHNVPTSDSVAIFFAGTVPYYAKEHRFVDLLGKTERTIAHESVTHGAIPGHNKFDFAYVYRERRPEVTFTSLPCPDVDSFEALPAAEQLEKIRQLTPYLYQAPIFQLVDPTFREKYLPHRVVLRDGEAPAGHTVGCWYVRDEGSVPTVWQLATR